MKTAVLLVASLCHAASAQVCHFPYNNLTRTLQSACFTVLGSEAGFEVREYSNSRDPGALVVRFNVSSQVTTYQEAFELGTFTVLGYFTGATNARHTSLLDARTTPLLLRPSRPASRTPWFIDMAIAPGIVPHPPPPTEGVEVVPLVPGPPILLAARHEQLGSGPQPSDFKACAAALVVSLRGSTSWRYNASSPVSPSFAYFTGQEDFEGPYDIECWVGIDRV